MSFRNLFRISLLHRKSVNISSQRLLSALPDTNLRSKHEYYNILEVSPNATLTEIREAYFRKVKECHPDINPSPEAREHFLLVREAYKVLANVDRRIGYDRSLHRSGSKIDGVLAETKEEFEREVKRKRDDQEVFEETKAQQEIGYTWGPQEEKSLGGAKSIKLNQYLNRRKESDLEEMREKARQGKIHEVNNKISSFFKKRFDLGGPQGDAMDGSDIEYMKKRVAKYGSILILTMLSGVIFEMSKYIGMS